MHRVRTSVTRLWNTDRPLTAAGVIMLVALPLSLAGIWLDPCTILGAPAWLKPAKFAASVAIYCLSLAWVFQYLPAWPRVRRVVGWTTSLVLLGEVVIIDAQVWRGTTSHFNVGTPLDATLFSVMGMGIFAQTATSVAVAVALWRQAFVDRALGWALRLGMTITLVGALTGGVMTRPTAAQLEEAARTTRLPVAGAHTVGGPDGGPGLPGTGWSVAHGDLRAPHFVGLHAIQALALFGFALPTSWSVLRCTRFLVAAALSYAVLFSVLLWQALRGESIVAPGATTLVALAAWAAVTAVGVGAAAIRLDDEADTVTRGGRA